MTILDSSALLAVLLDEPGAERVIPRLTGARMSAVNLAEVAGYYAFQGADPAEVRDMLALIPLDIVPADEALSLAAGELRGPTKDAGLSLGDRYCLALGLRESDQVLTADRLWERVAARIGVTLQLIR